MSHHLCDEVGAATSTLLRTHAQIYRVTQRSGVLISARPRDVPHTEVKPLCLPHISAYAYV
jgi:hypothetical protein